MFLVRPMFGNYRHSERWCRGQGWPQVLVLVEYSVDTDCNRADFVQLRALIDYSYTPADWVVGHIAQLGIAFLLAAGDMDMDWLGVAGLD
jgi:hypothetical protein